MPRSKKKSNEKPLECDICGRKIVRKDHMQDHMKKLHSGLDKKYKCPVLRCGVIAAYRSNMTVHLKNIHNFSEEKILNTPYLTVDPKTILVVKIKRRKRGRRANKVLISKTFLNSLWLKVQMTWMELKRSVNFKYKVNGILFDHVNGILRGISKLFCVEGTIVSNGASIHLTRASYR